MAAATLVSRSDAVSAAGVPSTSRRISAARWRGGSTCNAARNASSIVSRSTTTASGSSSVGASSSSNRSGYGCSQGISANERSSGTRRDLLRIMSKQTFVAILYSHARNIEPSSNVSR